MMINLFNNHIQDNHDFSIVERYDSYTNSLKDLESNEVASDKVTHRMQTSLQKDVTRIDIA